MSELAAALLVGIFLAMSYGFIGYVLVSVVFRWISEKDK